MTARTITLLLAAALAAHVHGQNPAHLHGEDGIETTRMELTCVLGAVQSLRQGCALSLLGNPTPAQTERFTVHRGDEREEREVPAHLKCSRLSRFGEVPEFVCTGEGMTVIYDREAQTISRCHLVGARPTDEAGWYQSITLTPGQCRVTHRNVEGIAPVENGDYANVWRVVKTTVEYSSCCHLDRLGGFEVRTTTTTECWMQFGKWGGCGEGDGDDG